MNDETELKTSWLLLYGTSPDTGKHFDMLIARVHYGLTKACAHAFFPPCGWHASRLGSVVMPLWWKRWKASARPPPRQSQRKRPAFERRKRTLTREAWVGIRNSSLDSDHLCCSTESTLSMTCPFARHA